MIARKIVYTGSIDQKAAETIYDIVRKIEITGEVKFPSLGRVELNLEGDPSMLKLAQHQVERAVKGLQKEVTPLPFNHYQGVDFLS